MEPENKNNMNNKKKEFEFIKESNSDKGNYVFQNDTTTKTGAYIIAAVLVGLIVAVAISGVFM